MTSADAYAEGFAAFGAGKAETDNPYDIDREFEAHCAWGDGWRAAYLEP